MYSNYIKCCRNCKYREVGCHGWCEEYKRQRAELDAIKAEELKKKLVESGLTSQTYDAQTRHIRRKRTFR